jgi:hypothetical protein
VHHLTQVSKATQWKPGQSGNLNGRPLGTRQRNNEICQTVTLAILFDHFVGTHTNCAQYRGNPRHSSSGQLCTVSNLDARLHALEGSDQQRMKKRLWLGCDPNDTRISATFMLILLGREAACPFSPNHHTGINF